MFGCVHGVQSALVSVNETTATLTLFNALVEEGFASFLAILSFICKFQSKKASVAIVSGHPVILQYEYWI